MRKGTGQQGFMLTRMLGAGSMYGQLSRDQPDKVANPARGQLSREN